MVECSGSGPDDLDFAGPDVPLAGEISADIAAGQVSFECQKRRLAQSKDGIVLSISIHPNDVPVELLSSDIGTRYYCVLVEIGDDERPVIPPRRISTDRTVASAGMLCREPAFQRWLYNKGTATESSEAAAAEAVRMLCGVSSRTELAHNANAQNAFAQLREDFKRDYSRATSRRLGGDGGTE